MPNQRGAFPSPETDALVCFVHQHLFPCAECRKVWKREDLAFRISTGLVILGFLVGIGGIGAIVTWLVRLG